MFVVGEDGNIELLTQGLAPKQFTSVYGQAPYLPARSSTSCGVFSGLNPHAGPYHHAAKTTQGIPIGAPVFQLSAGTLSSSISVSSLDQDLIDDYPEIRESTCWNSVDEGRLIIMVAPVRALSHNSSTRYPTIGRSEASDA
jgi:hypothetical protein